MLHEWALKWRLPHMALMELRTLMGAHTSMDLNAENLHKSESAIQNDIRLEGAQKGIKIWRNNVGSLPDRNGQWVRYGLCNETKALNKNIKSSDLIGIKPITILPSDVGTVKGIFVAREVKAGNWTYSGTEHENAQLKFIELVNSLGGDAQFTNKVGTL